MQALERLNPSRFDSPAILKALVSAHRALAEFKGVVASMPNQNILISTLGLQEAKDSSAIENIITTHDELFRRAVFPQGGSLATKEVARYSEALQAGWRKVREHGLLTTNTLLEVQAELEQNRAGLRKTSGTVLQDSTGRTVYTPPPPQELPGLMSDLDRFVNDGNLFIADPLVKMALIHHRFETIHPFYDGNGRTGRIANVLYLVKEGLLDSPVLYLSRAIVDTKADYYRLLQAVREQDKWEDWTLYLLSAVERTAAHGLVMVKDIDKLLKRYKHAIRDQYRFYSQDLINNLFSYPYTRIEFIMQDLGVSRITATRYLDELATGGFLHKHKAGRGNYYINEPLFAILSGETAAPASTPAL